MIATEATSDRMRFIDGTTDIIEEELRLRQPKHKRLEYVAGWNIHQLVKDARKSRPKLHTREGFSLKSSVSDIASTFSYRSSRSSSKSSRRSCITTVPSPSLSTTFRIYDMLRFHHVHGKNVALSNDRHTATRKSKSFCNGIVFGHRPVKFGEVVHLRFNKVRPDWRGCIKLGFTTYNPDRCDAHSLPSYAIPDLSRKSRFWAVPIAEKYATKFNVFSFIFKDDGSVSYMVNNEGKGLLLTGLQTKISLWPLLDLYGKVEEIAVVDDETAERGAALLGAGQGAEDKEESDSKEGKYGRRQSIVKGLGYMVAFHDVHGQNVKMDMRRTTAKRFDSFWNALTFTQEPLQTSDITFIEILKVESNYAGGLGIGWTNVDPSSFKTEDLPDNADLMVVSGRKQWKLSRDVETEEGDQFGFMLDQRGKIHYSKNGSPFEELFKEVSMSDKVWLIFDIYGKTTMIRLMGRIRNYLASDPENKETLAYDDLQDDDSEKECLMCFKKDRVKDCTIQPCGHTTLCSWCAITCIVKQQLRFIVCPVCGGPVQDVIRIWKKDGIKHFREAVDLSVAIDRWKKKSLGRVMNVIGKNN